MAYINSFPDQRHLYPYGQHSLERYINHVMPVGFVQFDLPNPSSETVVDKAYYSLSPEFYLRLELLIRNVALITDIKSDVTAYL